MADSIAKGIAYVDPALVGATIDNSVIGSKTPAAATVTTLTASGAVVASGNLAVGTSAANTLGFYGTAPATQRTSSNQTSSNIAVSASFGASQLAVVQEIMNTLVALGIYKGS